MCRFARNDDQGFLTVIAALKRYALDAPDVVAEWCQRTREVLENERIWQAGKLISRSASSEYVMGPCEEKEGEISQRPRSLVMRPPWQG